jgi:ribosomal protein L16/L10AE
MTEMANKKGHMKLTVEVEVNEELMDVAKEAMSQMSSKLPEIMRRGNQEKQE